jgi:hypothetical protein
MEVTSDQMGELDKEWVYERARGISQNDGLLLCEGQVYALSETVGKENQAAVADFVKISGLKRSRGTHNRRFISSGEMLESEPLEGFRRSNTAKETGVQLNGSKLCSAVNCDGLTMAGGTS